MQRDKTQIWHMQQIHTKQPNMHYGQSRLFIYSFIFCYHRYIHFLTWKWLCGIVCRKCMSEPSLLLSNFHAFLFSQTMADIKYTVLYSITMSLASHKECNLTETAGLQKSQTSGFHYMCIYVYIGYTVFPPKWFFPKISMYSFTAG